MNMCFNENRFAVVACVLLVSFFCPLVATPQCSSDELTAVFVVSGIYPGTELQLERLSVYPVGESNYPPEEQILNTIEALEPPISFQRTALVELVGSFYQYYQEPGDFGGVVLVDSRSGEFAFAGSVVHLGWGQIVVPESSSHGWALIPEAEAAAPDSVGIMGNPNWYDDAGWQAIYGTPTEITNSVIDYLRRTDVLHSFDDCGPYSVVSYIYTPAVGGTQPSMASCVLVVSGVCGPPWSDGPVHDDMRSWGDVKGLFR